MDNCERSRYRLHTTVHWHHLQKTLILCELIIKSGVEQILSEDQLLAPILSCKQTVCLLKLNGQSKTFKKKAAAKEYSLNIVFFSAFRIHLILTWIQIQILRSTFGKSGSRSEYLFFIFFKKKFMSDKL